MFFVQSDNAHIPIKSHGFHPQYYSPAYWYNFPAPQFSPRFSLSTLANKKLIPCCFSLFFLLARPGVKSGGRGEKRWAHKSARAFLSFALSCPHAHMYQDHGWIMNKNCRAWFEERKRERERIKQCTDPDLCDWTEREQGGKGTRGWGYERFRRFLKMYQDIMSRVPAVF